MNAVHVAALARKEWREIVRDRIFLALAFALPIVLMLVFGYGVSMDIEHMPIVVVDHDRTPSSRAYTDRFSHVEHFDFRGITSDEREAAALLSRAQVHAVVVIDAGFERDLAIGRDVAVQTIVDGSFVVTRIPRALEAYLDGITAAASAEWQIAWVSRRLGIPPERAVAIVHPIRIDVRYLHNAELRSIWSLAPSLIMFILVFVSPMLMALGAVREKETGAIYNIYASTVTRGEFLAGKLAPNIAIGAVNSVVLWLIAVLYFGAPFKGSVACFATGTLLYLVCATSMGLVLSLLVRTQQAALMITSILAVIVGFQYSGLFSPVQSMSGFAWLLAHAFPAMYYLDIVEGTFLKGQGFARLAHDLGALAVFAAAHIALAHVLFRKRSAA